MPAGPAFTPGRGPFGLLGFCGLPERKVFLVSFFVLFVFFFLLSFGLLDSFELTVFELFPVGFNVEVDRSIGGICVAVCDDFLYEGDDFRHVLSNSGDMIGHLDAERP